MAQADHTVVVLGTGGTIAGVAARPDDAVGYRAGVLTVNQLLQAAPGLTGHAIEAEQVAQLDSKDMRFDVWQTLLGRVRHHLARAEVTGVVVTHGTDTLEETAWFVARARQTLGATDKPVVLTAAMRPASATDADGPANLTHAVRLAAHGTAGVTEAFGGVVLAMGGDVWPVPGLQKVHTTALHAFGVRDGAPTAAFLNRLPPLIWPADETALEWPWVEIVVNAAGTTGHAVDALVAAGVKGLVVAGTGNASLHDALIAALQRAEAAGVAVLLVSRVLHGPLIPAGQAFECLSGLSAPQARVELMLRLMFAAPA